MTDSCVCIQTRKYMCGERSPLNHICTRRRKHPGQHIMCGAHMHRIAVWGVQGYAKSTTELKIAQKKPKKPKKFPANPERYVFNPCRANDQLPRGWQYEHDEDWVAHEIARGARADRVRHFNSTLDEYDYLEKLAKRNDS